MIGFGAGLLLLLFSGWCAYADSTEDLVAQAVALREAGDFKGAAQTLRTAIDGGRLESPVQNEAERQLDLLGRIKLDYSLSREELFHALQAAVFALTETEFDHWVKEGRFDGRLIDGEMRFVGVSVSNLFFRYPELILRRIKPKDDVAEQKGRLFQARAIKKAAREQRWPFVLPHRLQCTMTVAADAAATRPGEVIRAWLPLPRLYPYQCGVRVMTSSAPILKIAPPDSPIRAAYMEQPETAGKGAVFSIGYSFERDGVFFDLDPSLVTAPDLSDPELKKYTVEAPHVVFTPRIKELSAQLAGEETNPCRVAKACYDWVSGHILYSYAREYSTLGNLSDYTLTNHYGDCGQKAMLFITLCRSRGVPARWQSGWDLFPGFQDIHDWAEIYLPPYGWIPVDPWAGSYATIYCTALSADERNELRDFYFGGLDSWRMAANDDHSQTLDPPKRGLRSDDVDFQRGELEAGGTNIYFNHYKYSMDVKEVNTK